MAFCHECGSEVTDGDAFCPICGIAQHSPVLEKAAEEAEAKAEAPSVVESLPEDEFVDISALRPDSESAEKAEEPKKGVPEDEFVDISALKSEDATEANAEATASSPEDKGLDVSALKGDEGFEGASEAPSALPGDDFEDVGAIGDSAEPEIPEFPVASAAEPPAAASPVSETPEAEVPEQPERPSPEPPAAVSPSPEPPAPAILSGTESHAPKAEEPEPVAPKVEAAEEPEPAQPVVEAAEEPESAQPSEEAPGEPEPAQPAIEAPEEPAKGTRPEVRAVSDWETTGTEGSLGSEIKEATPEDSGSKGTVKEEPSVAERLVGGTPVPPAEEPAPAEPSATEDAEPGSDALAAQASEAEPEPVQELQTKTEPEEVIETDKEEAPGFLEDNTLIAMPQMDVAKIKAQHEAALKAEAEAEAKPEEEPAAPAAASSEPAPEISPVEEGQLGEPAKEESVSDQSSGADGTAVAAARSGSGEVEERSETTPNIGGGDTDGSRAPKLKPLSEGTVLNGRYEIVRKIGGGGMGAVYLASDKNLGGVLRAVKEMVQSYIEETQQEKAVQDFKRESMLLTSLEHPSIPTIYDYFFDEEAHRFYLVMKYISGGDLAAKLRSAPEGKLDEREVTEWGIQIADVLEYLHNRQPPIVYRDLKPANVMLDGNSGKVMLIDFGIARWINKEEKGVTAVGTMGYAPPELFSGNVVPSSDIYSLGSTMFHLLTGADPQNNPLLIFDFEKNPRPRQINPRISDQIEGIIMRAVEYNAEKRFLSAAEMKKALTDHLARLNAGGVTFGTTESPKSVGFSDQTVFCGFCGQKIVATDLFCAFCGAKQPLAQPGVQSREHIPVNLTAKLFIEGTSQLDYPSFELAKDDNLVGRRDPMSNIFPEVDLSKFDPQTKISRKHARIFKEGERYMLEDLGSSNGTIVIPANSESVRLAPHQAQALNHGDRIKLGDTMLHFVIGG